MKVYKYEGKKIEEIKNKILEDLKEKEENIIIVEKEVKGGLFKTKKIEANVLLIVEITEYIKNYIKNIAKLMNIEINIEVKNRDKNLSFLLISNQNNLLIGKNGKTIDALQTIIKKAVYIKTNIYINFTIDVGNYKKNQMSKIEQLAKKVARDVAKSKIEVQLDSMNSYERRIIHSILADDKYVCTQSYGEEPNRYIVIKPKGEK